MSYDVAVFAFARPDLTAALEAAGSDRVRVDGDPSAEQALVNLTRVTTRKEEHLCTIDGPLLAEDEDVPDAVASALLGCNWTMQLSVSSSLSRTAARIVEKVARALADSGEGVVYDPQAGEIVWPRTPKRLRYVQTEEPVEDVGRLELEWLWARRLTSRDARTMLKIFRRHLPEAAPVRFGTYEPMQGRLDRDGDEEFAALWDDVHMVFWKGTRPFDYGYVNLRRGSGSALSSEEREAMRPVLGGQKASEVDSVRLCFRTEVIDDPRWLGAIASLFKRVCDQFAPFFGAAYLSPDRNAETVALCGRWWLGVPPAELWLVYVGREYQRLLPADVPGSLRTEDGVLVTLADKPDDRTTINERQIQWPAAVVRRGDHLDDDRAALVIPQLDATGR